MKPEILIGDGDEYGSALFIDIQALDRLAHPDRCDTQQDRDAPDECPLLDNLRAADRILSICDASAEKARSDDAPNAQQSHAQQVARWCRGN